MTHTSCALLVLAAGKGTRMKSSKPKVLHEIAGRAMILHVLAATNTLKTTLKIAVVSPGMEDVAAVVTAFDKDVKIVIQEQANGTGHAVACARDAVVGFDGTIIVVFGDSPLMTADTFDRFRQLMTTCDVGVIGFRAVDATGYGRLIQSESGDLLAIREHKDASRGELEIDFCNSGVVGIASEYFAELIDALDNNNANGEYYLTDVVTLAAEKGLKVAAIECDESEVQGVNTREHLSKAEAVFQGRARLAAMANGVTLMAPETVFFSYDTVIEADVVIEPNVFFGPGVHISSGATIRAFSHIEGANIGQNANIGPYARLRPGANLAEGVKVGNFVEIKKAEIGIGAKVNHLSYVGDAIVGANANIGAGTITCNYDGFDKHLTEIGVGAFIGSNSALVAPVRIGKGAYVGSGSVITKDVDDDALAVARGKQKSSSGWAAKYRAKKLENKSKSKG